MLRRQGVGVASVAGSAHLNKKLTHLILDDDWYCAARLSLRYDDTVQ